MSKIIENLLINLEKIIGYVFKDKNLLLSAVTHPSFNIFLRNNREHDNYQRLEFLGDAILSAAIASVIYKMYFNLREGDLALIKANLVRTETLSKIGMSLGLGHYMLMDKGEEKCGGRSNKNNIENCLEAIIGAVYLDAGYYEVESIIIKLWKDLLLNNNSANIILQKGNKSRLQEMAQRNGGILPQYTVIRTIGLSHQPSFSIEVSLNGISAIATDSRKKSAEEKAAGFLLEKFGENK